MATGRTINKYSRVLVDGYDMSGDARSIGPLACTFAEGVDDPLNKDITGVWPGQATISPGTLNAIFDNTTDTGIFDVLGTPSGDRDVMIPIGIQTIPAEGDPVFCGQFLQDDFIVAPEALPTTATVKFGSNISGSANINYEVPWGFLLHGNSAETSSNTAIAITPYNASTSDGGWMMYQVFAAAGTSDMTATISIQDAATNSDGNFAALTGATTGSISCSSPTSGVIALSNTATVRSYLRWQLDLGTATSVTFALAFMRGR